MSAALPILFSAHHASADFKKFDKRCALSADQRLRYSDYGTDITVPQENCRRALISTCSRGIIDLNRAPDAPTLFPEKDFAKPEPNKIWKEGKQLTDAERARVLKDVYGRYHGMLLSRLKSFKRPGVVVAWDNTAHYIIGKNEAGEDTMMQPFILSNKGAEGSADVNQKIIESDPCPVTTCDPEFLREFATELGSALRRTGLPDAIALNLVYKGGYIPEHYNTRRHPELHALGIEQPIQSFQFEYDTLLTHPDQEPRNPDMTAMVKLRTAVERAMFNTYANLLVHSVGDLSRSIPEQALGNPERNE